MRQGLKIIVLLLILSGSVIAQNLTDSNLPIVIINTDGSVPIPDNPRVKGSMKIISRGGDQRNYVTDKDNPSYLNYNGRIDIEIRGSSSQEFDKKQYGFSTRMADGVTNNDVSLLGMPPENDWILNGMNWDSSLIRDYLCFNLSRQIGEYASRTAYCELIINGAYRGLYLLEEKIKADDNRVNVIEIKTYNFDLPELTGGYIIKADKTTPDDPVAWTMYSISGWPVNYIYHLPKPENIISVQAQYIHSQFLNLGKTAFDQNISPVDGFPSIIDIPSFINYMIISELSSNSDSYQLSTFFHKDRNGKLRAGPVWDSDLTFGNELWAWWWYGESRSQTGVWQFANGDNEGSVFWSDLFNNPSFRCYLSKRWNELIQPGQPLNLSSIGKFIDQTVSTISEAVTRNNTKWGTGSDASGISEIKSFLAARIPWMTTNLGSFSSCSDVPVPPLVITKIMYHPKASVYFADEDDFEFIEITNRSDKTTDLTGVYFGGTGFVYQFPAGSTLGPYKSLLLAGNSQNFQSVYGLVPYGQFTRHLSNKGENLVLLDAFGNVIENVSYSDSDPWPDADGNGYYLVLRDVNLDNNIAANWTVSDNLTLPTNDINIQTDLQLYPNPVNELLRIKAPCMIKSVCLYDICGHLLENININSEVYDMNMKQFNKGLYILKVNASGTYFTAKIVRN